MWYNRTIMLVEHQPTIFGDTVIVALSSRRNGTMSLRTRKAHETEVDVRDHQRQFLAENGITPKQTTIVLVDYDTDDFTRYREVQPSEQGNLMNPQPADALVATKPGHALFLPLGDCVGAVLYDPVKKVLMMSHLGRQSVEEYGAQKSVAYLQKKHNVAPQDVVVWLSVAVDSASYPLHAFGGKSLHEAIKEQLLAAGVMPEHLEIAAADTATHEAYYSHSQYLKGSDENFGRHAIVAMMREQSEPA